MVSTNGKTPAMPLSKVFASKLENNPTDLAMNNKGCPNRAAFANFHCFCSPRPLWAAFETNEIAASKCPTRGQGYEIIRSRSGA